MLRQFGAVVTLVAAALSVGDAAHYHFKVSKEATTAPTTSTANATSTNSSSPVAVQDANTWHMKQVTSVQARIQGDLPYWDADTKLWVSKFGTTIDERYTNVLDSVNTASVEGALMYVQAEGINLSEQSVKCERKNKMQYVVFYEMSIVQPTYAIVESQSHLPFCKDGGVEFDATNSNGFTVKQALKFWENPGDASANTQRAADMVTMYNKLAPNAKTGAMTALPTVADLTKANPKCYENSEKCATAANGCRRTLYAQLCEVCDKAGDGCEVAPKDFKYPTLVRPTQPPTPAPAKGKGKGNSTDAGDAQSSASALVSMGLALSAVVAAALL
ncbi:hypothetical protein PybrP1_008110 [[Pythium] brassicae (nom. inval.)]|nr:hypothetical protein PybrP1_008110 [[Pythium] brassicae (nom. inval.)]